MTDKNNIKVYIAMFFAILFWGISFIWSIQVLKFYRPITVIFLRLILSVIFVFFFGKIFKKIQKIEKKDYISILILSFFEPFAYFIGENFGLDNLSSTTTSVFISTIPMFSIIASYFFLKEKISFVNFLGILLSILGVFFVILKPNFKFKVNIAGLFFILLAVFSAVVYSLLVLKISNKYNVVTIIAYQNLIGVFMFLPLFLIFDFNNFLEVKFSWKFMLPLIELSVFASSFAFMFFTFGIKNLGVNRANTLTNLIPIVTAFFSFILLDEHFEWYNILGIIVVVVGLVFSQMKITRLVSPKLFD